LGQTSGVFVDFTGNWVAVERTTLMFHVKPSLVFRLLRERCCENQRPASQLAVAISRRVQQDNPAQERPMGQSRRSVPPGFAAPRCGSGSCV
jgi:hypothetical protein